MIDPVGRTTTQEPPPPMLLRRLMARTLDTGFAIVLSGLIVWPLAWGAVSDALTTGGFGSVPDLLQSGPTTAPVGTAAETAVQNLQPVVVSALLLQLAIGWCYEVFFLSLTGSTPGKGLLRLRVVRHDRAAPTLAPVHPVAHRPRARRFLRAALRTAIVIGPPALSAIMLVAAWLGTPDATDVSEVTIALTLVLGVVWLAGGIGAHGLLSGTAVVPFSWRQARAAGEEYLREQAADPARRQQLTGAADRARAAGEGYAERALGAAERYLQEHGGTGGLRDSVARRLPSGRANRPEE